MRYIYVYMFIYQVYDVIIYIYIYSIPTATTMTIKMVMSNVMACGSNSSIIREVCVHEEGCEPHERFSAEQDKPEYTYSPAAGTAATAIIVYSRLLRSREMMRTLYIYI